MVNPPAPVNVGALWRGALEALAHAFDPARDCDDEDTVFQTRRARRESAERDDCGQPAARRAPEETLQ